MPYRVCNHASHKFEHFNWFNLDHHQLWLAWLVHVQVCQLFCDYRVGNIISFAWLLIYQLPENWVWYLEENAIEWVTNQYFLGQQQCSSKSAFVNSTNSGCTRGCYSIIQTWEIAFDKRRKRKKIAINSLSIVEAAQRTFWITGKQLVRNNKAREKPGRKQSEQ